MKAEETGDRLEALGLDNGLSRSPLAGLAAHQLVSVQMSANGFPAIEQKPMLGRDFMAEDERPGAPPVVMLSYSVWQNRQEPEEFLTVSLLFRHRIFRKS
jgi:hypothetical protein